MTDVREDRAFWRRLGSAVHSEWRELGALGRVAFLGILVSVLMAVGLAFWIPNLATSHLLSARAEFMSEIGDRLAADGFVPFGPPGSPSFEALEREIGLRVVGGETVRVKLWSLDGTITYSDEPNLVGRRFGLSESARRALDGETTFNISDLSDPAHAGERDLDRLIEFYVPIRSNTGEPIGLLEIEQDVEELDNTRGHIQTTVLAAVLSGLGVLALFLSTLTVASARMLNRRRKNAEDLLSSLLRAGEEERKRTVGALHDDIGQPLYRLLYGIQSTRSKLPADSEATGELANLEAIVRDIDRTLRAQLRLLYRGVSEDLSLEDAIEDLIDVTSKEAGLELDLDMPNDIGELVNDAGRVALLHASREGLINVQKHAASDRASIRFRAEGDRVMLDIVDNGRGTDGTEGLGIVTLRERLEAIGGGLVVSRERGGGTRFSAWVLRKHGDPS